LQHFSIIHIFIGIISFALQHHKLTEFMR